MLLSLKKSDNIQIAQVSTTLWLVSIRKNDLPGVKLSFSNIIRFLHVRFRG
ncbi:hypothetical protein HMPREF1862_00636 [Varibaculum cambriense]|uniref:Uncharacterized protein n=1 Tax=Varibaculum cambriense TaxID=184870 RepID=A0AB34WZP9_9ACTO|nr:hypothetical protein HMPREF1862_00636 [Varibaculum cambriense]